jgi:serine/threonine protein kinase
LPFKLPARKKSYDQVSSSSGSSFSFRHKISNGGLSRPIVFKKEDIIADEINSTLPEQLLTPGAILDGRFQIISLVGTGGMCTVYKARHLLMEYELALKVLHRRLVTGDEAIKRLQLEAVMLAALEHPNIIKVYGCGMVEGVPYLAVEYLKGISLSDLLKQETRLPFERALPILNQILAGLAHAHERGIIHRDLNPGNVMLTGNTSYDMQVKLVDFGIARILPESGRQLQRPTRTGAVFGTASYMSPEQCRAAPVDTRTDIYSMGCLIFEVLDGQPALVGDTPLLTMAKHLNESPRESPFITGALASVVMAALEKDPALRQQSADELNQQLNDPESAVVRQVKKRHEKHKSLTVPVLLTFSLAFSMALGTIYWSIQALKLRLIEDSDRTMSKYSLRQLYAKSYAEYWHYRLTKTTADGFQQCLDQENTPHLSLSKEELARAKAGLLYIKVHEGPASLRDPKVLIMAQQAVETLRSVSSRKGADWDRDYFQSLEGLAQVFTARADEKGAFRCWAEALAYAESHNMMHQVSLVRQEMAASRIQLLQPIRQDSQPRSEP